MLKAIFDWFRQPSPKALAPDVQPEAVPYKVEPPVQVAPTMSPTEPVKCGCGRSPTGLCVGLHKLTPEQWAAEQARGSCQKNNNDCDTPAPTTCPAPVAEDKPTAKKPAAMKASAKKATARKPRTKKSQ